MSYSNRKCMFCKAILVCWNVGNFWSIMFFGQLEIAIFSVNPNGNFSIDQKLKKNWSTCIEFYYTSSKCTCLNLKNILKIGTKPFGQLAIFFRSTHNLVNRYSTIFKIKKFHPMSIPCLNGPTPTGSLCQGCQLPMWH